MALCFSENKPFLKFQRNKVFYSKRSIKADPQLRFLLWVEGRGERSACDFFFFLIEGRWLPVSRLSVKTCVKSNLSPNQTHLAAMVFLSFLRRGRKSHFFHMELSPACFSRYTVADAYNVRGESNLGGHLVKLPTHYLEYREYFRSLILFYFIIFV